MRISRLALVVYLLAGSFIASPADASTYNLSPTADTFVWSGLDANYGTSTTLVSDYYAYDTNRKYSYLKFDLSGISGSEVITGATLFLYQSDYNYKTDYTHSNGTNLYRIADDGWTETDLKWSNKPSGTGTLIAAQNIPDTLVGWTSWDLFQIAGWVPGGDQSDGLLSLLLTEAQFTYWNEHYFYSRENASNQPYLVVTTAPVPIPGAVWLLGSGLLGLVTFRRRFRK
jgi:hypothetical protein